MALIIYHNSRCAKSRKGLEYLKSKTPDFIVIEYLKNGVSVIELKEICLKMNVRPPDLVRIKEELFRKELKGKNFTDQEWLQIISENPKLLRRPLVIGRQKGVLGDPPENIDRVLS